MDYNWAQISRSIAEIADDKSLTFAEKYQRLCNLALAIGLPEETFIDVLGEQQSESEGTDTGSVQTSPRNENRIDYQWDWGLIMRDVADILYDRELTYDQKCQRLSEIAAGIILPADTFIVLLNVAELIAARGYSQGLAQGREKTEETKTLDLEMMRAALRLAEASRNDKFAIDEHVTVENSPFGYASLLYRDHDVIMLFDVSTVHCDDVAKTLLDRYKSRMFTHCLERGAITTGRIFDEFCEGDIDIDELRYVMWNIEDE